MGTPKDQLLAPDKPKKIKGLSIEKIARMEQEMKAIEPNFKEVEQTYGERAQSHSRQGICKKALEKCQSGKVFVVEAFRHLCRI